MNLSSYSYLLVYWSHFWLWDGLPLDEKPFKIPLELVLVMCLDVPVDGLRETFLVGYLGLPSEALFGNGDIRGS